MLMTRSGILLIDKSEGPSSAQVVHQVKEILRAKKVGHLGTLDPFASGLLLVGINEGTKVADVFLGGVKSYHGVMVLGVETDTQDATGKVLNEQPVPEVEAEYPRAPMFGRLPARGLYARHVDGLGLRDVRFTGGDGDDRVALVTDDVALLS